MCGLVWLVNSWRPVLDVWLCVESLGRASSAIQDPALLFWSMCQTYSQAWKHLLLKPCGWNCGRGNTGQSFKTAPVHSTKGEYGGWTNSTQCPDNGKTKGTISKNGSLEIAPSSRKPAVEGQGGFLVFLPGLLFQGNTWPQLKIFLKDAVGNAVSFYWTHKTESKEHVLNPPTTTSRQNILTVTNAGNLKPKVRPYDYCKRYPATWGTPYRHRTS